MEKQRYDGWYNNMAYPGLATNHLLSLLFIPKVQQQGLFGEACDRPCVVRRFYKKSGAGTRLPPLQKYILSAVKKLKERNCVSDYTWVFLPRLGFEGEQVD